MGEEGRTVMAGIVGGMKMDPAFPGIGLGDECRVPMGNGWMDLRFGGKRRTTEPSRFDVGHGGRRGIRLRMRTQAGRRRRQAASSTPRRGGKRGSEEKEDGMRFGMIFFVRFVDTCRESLTKE